MMKPHFLFLGLLIFLNLASAQSPTPETLADEAVQAWQLKEAPTFQGLAGLGSDQLCMELPDLLYAAPQGLEVNLNSRQDVDLPEGAPETFLQFSYPASQPGDIVGAVRVTLEQVEDEWTVQSVRYTPEILQGGFRTWLSSLAGSLLFTVFSLFFIYLAITKSFLRKLLSEGIGFLKEHKKTTIITIVLLYGLFALGYGAGTGLPASCGDLMLGLVQQSLEQLDIPAATGSGNIAGLSAAIFYQNFTFGAFITTYLPALFFGIPAYLFNGSRFFALALLFGYSGLGGFFQAILALILFLVELMAYVLVTAGGGMLLMTLIRGGFKAFRLGLRKLALMLPIAMLLLIVGAWYEATIIMLPLLLRGP